MQVQTIYVLLCVFIAVGGYVACFYFARKDWFFYALASFAIGSSAFAAIAKVVYDTPK